jgi:hypothetical protein
MGLLALSPGGSFTEPPCSALVQESYIKLVTNHTCMYVVVVNAENERTAAAFNEDGFTSVRSNAQNRNGFIASIEEDGSIGTQYDRNGRMGMTNMPEYGPSFRSDQCIGIIGIADVKTCLGYGVGTEANETTLFGIEKLPVRNYEVFKISIE